MLGKIAESRTLNAGLTRPVCVPNVFVRVVCGGGGEVVGRGVVVHSTCHQHRAGNADSLYRFRTDLFHLPHLHYVLSLWSLRARG